MSVQQYCFSGPCKNGGKCLEISNGYRCKCLSGFTGENCEGKNDYDDDDDDDDDDVDDDFDDDDDDDDDDDVDGGGSGGGGGSDYGDVTFIEYRLIFIDTFQMSYSVLQTRVNMMANAWRQYRGTSVFAKKDTEGITAKARIINNP